ncbi:deoxyribose-phosphate aldolase [Temnothorax curvispinosus]|uniref:deoxyribose-phosphate aldolase n=2 Tax=Temnothorax TaxID=300110 RepID=A0A6J1QES7_9HYME|nr:deoxyribose-phosphate aldolase [Temnothorax curvispinosus]
MDNRPVVFHVTDTIQAWLKFLEVYINEPAVHKSVRQITYLAEMITGDNKVAWLLKAISFIDLTSLSHDDTSSTVEELCKNAVKPIEKLPFAWNNPLHTAAVCVYPSKVKDAVSALKKFKNKEDAVKIASVAAGFPSGQYPLETRLQEVRYAIEYGAQEIDVVIDRSLVINHEWVQLYNELEAIRSACNETYDKASDKASDENKKKEQICLKVIISSGELFNLRDVYKASMVALFAGADFIKTSTGKDTVNATLPMGIVMCRAIKEFERLAGKKMGFKPAGGIKTAQEALQWMVLVKEELGKDWLTRDRFRIGASTLLHDICSEIVKTYEDSKAQSVDVSEEKVFKSEEKKDERKKK